MRKSQPDIVIDGTECISAKPSGIGHYALGITSGLDALSEDGILSYSILLRKKTADHLKHLPLDNLSRKYTFGSLRRNIAHQIVKRKLGITMDSLLPKGAYYFPAFHALPMRSRTSAVVVHDMAYRDIPECVTQYHVDRLTRTLANTVSSVGNVIAVSEFTKERILHYFDIDPDRIYVAPPAVDRELYRPMETKRAELIRKKYGVECGQYILSVGNLEPRKNLVSLIKAFSTLPASVLKDFSLVLVGADGWNKEELERCIHEATSLGVAIVRPNAFVADEDMPAFYSGAHGFAFVPLYEGFGMPTLEAYACGVPVLATRVPSLREQGSRESAALFVERPHDIEEIAAGLLRLVSINANERAGKRIAMEQHLSGFSWKRSALVTARAVLGESASDTLRTFQEASANPLNAATCVMA